MLNVDRANPLDEVYQAALGAAGYAVNRLQPGRPGAVRDDFSAAFTGASALLVVAHLPPPMGGWARRRYRASLEQAAGELPHIVAAARGAAVARLILVWPASLERAPRNVARSLTRMTSDAQRRSAIFARAASQFCPEGHDVVSLRPGWVHGPNDPITRHLAGGARRGWQLLDGTDEAPLPAVQHDDMGTAITLAIGAPSGTYPIRAETLTAAGVNKELAEATGCELHPLLDDRWMAFPSSLIDFDSHRFARATGWAPNSAGFGPAALIRPPSESAPPQIWNTPIRGQGAGPQRCSRPHG